MVLVMALRCTDGVTLGILFSISELFKFFHLQNGGFLPYHKELLI